MQVQGEVLASARCTVIIHACCTILYIAVYMYSYIDSIITVTILSNDNTVNSQKYIYTKILTKNIEATIVYILFIFNIINRNGQYIPVIVGKIKTLSNYTTHKNISERSFCIRKIIIK